MKIETCDKCMGTGFLEEHKYINEGLCYKCNGTGKMEVSERVQQNRVNRMAEVEKQQRAYDMAVIEAFRKPIGFGKHADKRINQLPESYMRWLVSNHKDSIFVEAVKIVLFEDVEEYQRLQALNKELRGAK